METFSMDSLETKVMRERKRRGKEELVKQFTLSKLDVLSLSQTSHMVTLTQSPSHTPHLGHRGEGIPPCTVPGLDTKKVAVLHLPIK